MKCKALCLFCVLMLAACGVEGLAVYQAMSMDASFSYPSRWQVSELVEDRGDEAFSFLNSQGDQSMVMSLQTVPLDNNSLLEILEKKLDTVISADDVSQATITLQPGLIETEYALQARARVSVTMNDPSAFSFDWYFVAIELGNDDAGIMSITHVDWIMRLYERELELVANSFRPVSKP